ncbi:50S ribosomal protein L24 [Companilactobacillus sp. DQM5]|uniref:50S ribosomal protein L24 n=1 Tax=Companilactobacillus sp. DQM5 TaxID=3463359 RepID=UPI004059D192
MFVKTGDNVKVISGNDKGKEGKVLKVFPKNDKVLVEGINVAKKHQKPTNQEPNGGIVDAEMPISVSNVALAKKSAKKTTTSKTTTKKTTAKKTTKKETTKSTSKKDDK